MVVGWVRVLAVLLLCCPLAAASELQFYTEENPPLSFSRDGQLDGLSVAAVRELLWRTGDSGSIQMVPWARGYMRAQHSPNVGLFVTVRTPEREALFQWVGPLLSTTTSFYARRGSGLRIASLDDAREVEGIGVPRDWYSQQFLERMGFSNLQRISKPHEILRMVLHKRIPLMVYEDQLLPGLMAELGGSMDDLEKLHPLMQSSSYIVFSLNTDVKLVKRWQAALDGMRRDGSLAKLHGQWLPDSPPPVTDAQP
ncbi:MAG: ABC transporter substrate-binding protein [Pseudomonadota bacterium]